MSYKVPERLANEPTSDELNRRLANHGIMISLDEARTSLEVARDFGLLTVGEMVIEAATDTETEV